MTKIERDAMIETIRGNVAVRCDMLTAKYATKVENARKRVADSVRFYQTEKFLGFVIDYGVNLDSLFAMCDKTHKRFITVVDSLLRSDLTLRDDRDQSRYTFNLARSVIAANKVKAHLAKSDVLATASKREGASDFVTVSQRVMSDSTAERQAQIARTVCKVLGLIDSVRTENGQVVLKCNTKSKAYRTFDKLMTA